MRRQLDEGKIERQNLLIPQILELPASEVAFFEEKLGVVDHLGFTIERFGPNSFAIKTIPAMLPPGDYRQAVRSMIAEIAEVGQSAELHQELEERLATMACHSVIRAGRKLDREEIRALLGELDRIDFATQCPHGRPVLLEFTEEQLERMFKRA
jgi:DNA mismatch repair protein MutL